MYMAIIIDLIKMSVMKITESQHKENTAQARRKRASITECLEFIFSLEGKEVMGRALYLALFLMEKIPPMYTSPSDKENMEFLREVAFGEGYEKGRREFQFLEGIDLQITPYNEYLKLIVQQKGGHDGEII